MTTLKVLNRDGNSITFADPADPNYQVRFKTTSTKKVLKGVSVDNYVTEIICGDDYAITLPGMTGPVDDATSVRVRFSGTVYSQEHIVAIFNSIASAVTAWHAEGVLVGFEPTTLPVKPV